MLKLNLRGQDETQDENRKCHHHICDRGSNMHPCKSCSEASDLAPNQSSRQHAAEQSCCYLKPLIIPGMSNSSRKVPAESTLETILKTINVNVTPT